MGQVEQFAKQVFAEETAAVTHGGVVWKGPVELGLAEVRLDGLLVVRESATLADLAPPWTEAAGHEEVVLELKMPGDHLDMRPVRRALLRRQAREVVRVEAPESTWDGEVPLWIVAPRVPATLREKRSVAKVARGCYRVEPASFPFLWIAANELPLADELMPFLVARSGKPLQEMLYWAAARKPFALVERMVKYLSMALVEQRGQQPDLLAEDIVFRNERERAEWIFQEFLKDVPALRDVIADVQNARAVDNARRSLRIVLDSRNLAPTAEEQARIDACADLATLDRWLSQAVSATSVAEALA